LFDPDLKLCYIAGKSLRNEEEELARLGIKNGVKVMLIGKKVGCTVFSQFLEMFKILSKSPRE